MGGTKKWITKSGKYKLRFAINNKYTYLGTFATKEEVQNAIENHKNNIKE